MQGTQPLTETPTSRVLRRFWANPVAIPSVTIILFLTLIAGGIVLLSATGHDWPCNPNQTNLELKLLPPSPQHWMGTDNLGRDVLSRMLHGASISLTVGLVAVAVSLGIGITVGAIAGYFGGIIDQILMRAVDALLCFPTFFLIQIPGSGNSSVSTALGTSEPELVEPCRMRYRKEEAAART